MVGQSGTVFAAEMPVIWGWWLGQGLAGNFWEKMIRGGG